MNSKIPSGDRDNSDRLLQLVPPPENRNSTPPDRNYAQFLDLFHEFEAKLVEQHTYYIESVIGFDVLYKRILAKQAISKDLLANSELANDEFLDTTGALYKEISDIDIQPFSLSPVMKQGDIKDRTRKDGKNTLLLGSNCVVSLYSYWEEYLRIQIGIALGVLSIEATNTEATRKILNAHVTSDLWGDLRHLRNSIVHGKGIAYSKISSCELIQWFKPGDEIELTFERMRAIFSALAWFRNRLHTFSLVPQAPIRMPTFGSGA